MKATTSPKDILLTSLYTSKEVDDVMQKINPAHDRDDIKQHVFVELFQKDEAFIIDLDQRGKLRSYVVKMIYNTANFSEGSFQRQRRRRTEIPTDSFGDEPGKQKQGGRRLSSRQGRDSKEIANHIMQESEWQEDSYDYEELVKTCAVRTEAIYWYNRDLLKLYVEHGTYRKVAQLTGIPLLSVHHAIKQAKEEIKRMLWE